VEKKERLNRDTREKHAKKGKWGVKLKEQETTKPRNRGEVLKKKRERENGEKKKKL